MSEEMFGEAIRALKSGQRRRARDLLTRLLKTEPNNADYWLWMSATVDTEKEQVFCLQKALKIDPNSIPARRGLVLMGALTPEAAALPPAPSLDEFTPTLPAMKAAGRVGDFFARPRNREILLITLASLVAVVAIGALLIAIFAPQVFRPPRVVVVTSTVPPTLSPTATATATATATVEPCRPPDDPNPATPLAAYWCLTQTPAPPPVPTADTPAEDYASLVRLYTAGLSGDTGAWSQVLAKTALLRRDQVLSNDPTVYFFEAEALRSTGQYQAAIASYREALDRNNALAPAHLGKALAELAAENTNAAGRSLDAAVAADPASVAAHLARAEFLEARGDVAGALTELEAAQALAPDSPATLSRLALAYSTAGRAVEAQALAEQALAQDPGQVIAWYAQGRAAYTLSDYGAAQRAFSLSIPYLVDAAAFAQWFPITAALGAGDLAAGEALYFAGVTQAALADPEAALATLDAALARRPTGLPRALLARGQLHLAAARYAEAQADFGAAIPQFQRAGADTAGLVDALVGRGQARLALTPPRPDQALTDFRQAAELAPDRFDAALGLGQAQVLSGRATDAVTSLTVALGLAPADPQRAQVFWWRSQAFLALEQRADLIADLESLAALTASDGLAPTAVARLTEVGPLVSPTSPATGTPTATRAAAGSATPTRTRTPTPPATPGAAAQGTGYPAGTPAGGYPAPAGTASPTRSRTP